MLQSPAAAMTVAMLFGGLGGATLGSLLVLVSRAKARGTGEYGVRVYALRAVLTTLAMHVCLDILIQLPSLYGNVAADEERLLHRALLGFTGMMTVVCVIGYRYVRLAAAR